MDKKPLGIMILGSALIVTYFYMFAQYVAPGGYDAYKVVFQSMPEHAILTRYCFSIFLRIVGIACGIGIILRKEAFRRLAIGLGLFNIATIFLKHPYFYVHRMMEGFSKAAADVTGFTAAGLPEAIQQQAVFALISLYATDIGFAVYMIAYLRMPQTRAWFKTGVVPKELMGAAVLGILLMIFSVAQFEKLLSWEYYRWLFQPFPKDGVFIRYGVSILLRTLAFVAGLGILLKRDLFRRLAVLVSIASALTVFFRFPFWVFIRHEKVAFGVVAKLMGFPEITRPPLFNIGLGISAALFYAMELGFPVLLIFYFSRPVVKQWFKQSGSVVK